MCSQRGMMGMTLLLLLVALGMLVAGVLSSVWMKISVLNSGLWKSCFAGTCAARKDVLHFDNSVELDICLSLILGSGGFAFLALISCMSGLCKDRVGCCAVLTGLLALLAGLCGGGCVGYYEWTFLRSSSYISRGWGDMVSYVASGLLIFTSFIAFIAACMSPKQTTESREGGIPMNHYKDPPPPVAPGYHTGGYQSVGYQSGGYGQEGYHPGPYQHGGYNYDGYPNNGYR